MGEAASLPIVFIVLAESDFMEVAPSCHGDAIANSVCAIVCAIGIEPDFRLDGDNA